MEKRSVQLCSCDMPQLFAPLCHALRERELVVRTSRVARYSHPAGACSIAHENHLSVVIRNDQKSEMNGFILDRK